MSVQQSTSFNNSVNNKDNLYNDHTTAIWLLEQYTTSYVREMENEKRYCKDYRCASCEKPLEDWHALEEHKDTHHAGGPPPLAPSLKHAPPRRSLFQSSPPSSRSQYSSPVIPSSPLLAYLPNLAVKNSQLSSYTIAEPAVIVEEGSMEEVLWQMYHPNIYDAIRDELTSNLNGLPVYGGWEMDIENEMAAGILSYQVEKAEAQRMREFKQRMEEGKEQHAELSAMAARRECSLSTQVGVNEFSSIPLTVFTPSQKPYKCQTPGCLKAYQQKRGLTYHNEQGVCIFPPDHPSYAPKKLRKKPRQLSESEAKAKKAAKINYAKGKLEENEKEKAGNKLPPATGSSGPSSTSSMSSSASTSSTSLLPPALPSFTSSPLFAPTLAHPLPFSYRPGLYVGPMTAAPTRPTYDVPWAPSSSSSAWRAPYSPRHSQRVMTSFSSERGHVASGIPAESQDAVPSSTSAQVSSSQPQHISGRQRSQQSYMQGGTSSSPKPPSALLPAVAPSTWASGSAPVSASASTPHSTHEYNKYRSNPIVPLPLPYNFSMLLPPPPTNTNNSAPPAGDSKAEAHAALKAESTRIEQFQKDFRGENL